MTVALVANHSQNGFFIFRPGEGYEYVPTILLASCALGALGGGAWSIDHARPPTGWALGLAVAFLGGIVPAAVLLAVCWRPIRVTRTGSTARTDAET